MDYFRQYLLHYLRLDFPELLRILPPGELETLLTIRTQDATTTFEKRRLEGVSIPTAQEDALVTLTEGLSFSAYTFLHDVLESEFKPNFIQLSQQGDLTKWLCERCQAWSVILNNYQQAEGAIQRQLYAQIVGEMAQFFNDF